ncbi:MAG: leucine-rich repeat protein [Clostridia bacterium]|nr:leucine-rich repeat protein [Clostridia bacterium]
MAAIKAKCPMCGGTVIIPEGKTFGECDSCAVQFSLSDLQKYKEQTGQAEHTEPEGVDIDGDGLLDYTTALSTDNIIHESVAELCNKAEVALQAEMWSLVYRFCDEIIRRDPHYAKAYLYKLLADCRIYKKEALADSKKLFDTNENYRLLIRFADTYLAAEIESYLTTARNRLAEAQSEEKYQMLCRDMRNADSENVLRRLIKSFQELGDYRDSEKRKQECEDRLKRLQAKNATKKGVTIAVFALIAAAIIGGIIAIIAAIAGAISAHSASYDKSNFTVEITDKSNDDYDDSTVRVIFDIDFTNNTSHNATRIVGYLKVKDCDGNILTNGDAHFDGEFLPSIRDDWTLTWRMSRNDDSAELWNTRFELLEILFCITELRFEDGTVRNYEIEDVVVKPYDTAYADKQYVAATTCFDNGQYAEAQELFEKLRGYKDSEDRAEECKREATRIEMANKEEQYLTAKNMVAEGDYLGAVKLFRELDDYRDSADLLELIENNLADVALEYSLKGDYRLAVELIEGFDYSLDDWNIPDDIYDVLKANKNAIDGSYTKLVSLGIADFVIPAGTTKIKDSAFQDAIGLNSVTIPVGVTTIGKYAFKGCASLTTIVIPDGITSIGNNAFDSCSSLSTISLPSSLRTVGNCVFYYCRSLTTVNLPVGLTSIGSEAFGYCSAIGKLTIPDTVTYIGPKMLLRCNGLTEITMPIVEGFTVSSFFDYQVPTSFVRVTLTKGKTLGYHYFYNCNTLVEINLHEGLEVIGEESLAYCSATTINFPDTIKEIKSGAFRNSSITSFTLPTAITEIPDNLFAYSYLKTINLHGNVTSIGASAFQGCSLTISFEGTKEKWESVSKDSLWNYSVSSYTIICTDATYTYKYGTGSWA